MYSLDQIKHLHIELSSLCNAQCPLCPRNAYGYKHNFGYIERNLTLEDVKKIFPIEFIKQLKEILINGNFGDMVMNPETPDIVHWFRQHNPSAYIYISTNGGARDQEFWETLAALECRIYFCIDGLEDTHSIYRRNTVFNTVIQNAKTFIKAGGYAIWKFIQFDHNAHQAYDAKIKSRQLGFEEFTIVDQGRSRGPIFNNDGKYIGSLGEPYDYYSDELLQWTITDNHEDQKINEPKKTITCEVADSKSIYVDSTGDVYPCCYVGFAPRTFRGMRTEVNLNLIPLLGPNNAIENDFASCMDWFGNVEASWDKEWHENRCLICNETCGKHGHRENITWDSS